jgi:hypothetical protein
MKTREECIREFENLAREISSQYPNPFKTDIKIHSANGIQEKSDIYSHYLLGLYNELSEKSKQLLRTKRSLEENKMLMEAIENIIYDEVHNFMMVSD